MQKRKLIFSLALALIAVLPVYAQSLKWERLPVDGHRRSEGSLSPTALKEQKLLNSLYPKMDSLKFEIGYCPEGMASYSPQSPLSNFIVDSFREMARWHAGEICDLAFLNFGGIRTDMPKGEVLMEDLMGMLPFNNKLCILHVKGAWIQQLFEYMAKTELLAFSGAKAVIEGDRLCSLTIGGKDVVPDSTYTVATISFLMNGGDGFHFIKGDPSPKVIDLTPFDLILEKICRSNEILMRSTDDRITVTGRTAVKEEEPELPFVKGDEKFQTKLSRLVILHTNDTHSNLDTLRDVAFNGWGGVVERAALIDSVRKAAGKRNVLLLDAGDYVQGTAYFPMFKGAAEIRSMNLMHYDVCTLGNHEWDNGLEDLVSMLKKARFKTVLSNYAVNDKKFSRLVKPYVIVKRAGLRIGIVGTLARMRTLTENDFSRKVEYLDPVESVNRYSRYLKEKEHCDIVILLSHCGLTKCHDEMWDLRMVPNLHNVDMVIGGHSHSDIPAPCCLDDADGKPVMIVTAYYKGLYAGCISETKQ